MIDPYFKAYPIAKTPRPQTVAFAAMHQCYSPDYVYDEIVEGEDFVDPFSSELLTEAVAGERVIRHCLKFKHFGVLEAPQITFSVGFFPHSVMQQLRTHRIGVSFDVQSFRYTSQSIRIVANRPDLVETAFYFRPEGFYTDRKGTKYNYTLELIEAEKQNCVKAAKHYVDLVDNFGLSEEHARDCIPFSVRQHFLATFNLRSLFHVLDMRTPQDAQLEIRQLCDLLWPHVEEWVPEFASFYKKTRWSKNNLAP